MGPKFCLVMGENTMFEMMRFQKSSGPGHGGLNHIGAASRRRILGGSRVQTMDVFCCFLTGGR